MASRPDTIPNRRGIIDRRALVDQLAEAMPGAQGYEARRAVLATTLRAALAQGRAELHRRLHNTPAKGLELASAQAFLVDQLLRILFDSVVTDLYPATNRTSSERLALVAVGGYGRGQMAPHSDIDLLFLTPWKQTAWGEQVIETMLYMLWDLGLKVGHATRSLDDMINMSRADVTIRTALLESRFVWGDQKLYEEGAARFRREVVAGTARAFTAEKLVERDERHKRMGDSRYVVEPNLKEGKGGLRDLHTLFWIGKYAYQVDTIAELVDKGLLTANELRQFRRAESFLWAVRINLHDIAGRPEERLTFDVQRELASRLRYADRGGMSAVERFMRHYFLVAKTVGDLTGLFLAHLDESFAKSNWLPTLTRRPSRLNGFTLRRSQIGVPSDDFFRQDPVRLVEMFALADREKLGIHPQAMRQASRDAGLINETTRRSRAANALFLQVLTSPNDPETVLRWMNEAGIFGRFVPDFGRVVAQMQYDMYHHYTVDEHTIRAIGLLAQIESGKLLAEHKLSSAIIKQIASRRVLYVAVLLHDIAKGRGGDHSELGGDIADRLCPRLGLGAAETETVAWLVRNHLLMSRTAFKRDLADFKTILDFVESVASPERLRLLLLLTVVDIRAVGPGVWNNWKGQLLRDLYEASEEVLRLGHKQKGRTERIAVKQARLRAALGWDDATFGRYTRRFADSYWIAETPEALAGNAALVADADARSLPLAIATLPDPSSGTTLVSIYAADHPGLFYRIAGAISLAGANILDARIHTTRDGQAIDNFVVADPLGRPFAEPSQLARLTRSIEDVLTGKVRLADRLAARPLARRRAEVFKVEPNIIIDNKASNRYTVIEVGAADRPALLYALTHALFQSRVTIHSAHIATYGERATDTFYITDLTGQKIDSASRLKALERRLVAVASSASARVDSVDELQAAE
ncbi:[protein-PII] uridylyltransferase [Polymorphobacter fuscus]|uniref:Bifunctional uridylyltransferase/uridylyl-removing enzyme n=1 Tax=Sandarakinorhabdus fusca TaxID=1439888 RepID=A0A7C9GPM0_9SPHN|nr:[protein-PII] uridylyltransferase [Polymorphobacter fuscus]KAB7646400.1 [protein-PII] uridylyltransferase [Polymorphobacter fuscus]MQT17635.1 [protein-PII] uridylyltransferase [Polymorphobacter fuscus]NJC09821.1 [protein-PII] uridylyltransferase [Polymorphobacter fuscus]